MNTMPMFHGAVFTAVVEKPLSSIYLFKIPLIETDQANLCFKSIDQVWDCLADYVNQF